VTAGFLAAAAISLLHRVLGGVVLSSQLLSVLSLCGGFVAGYVLLCRAGSGAAALQTGSRPDPVALGVACVGVLLVFATYWGSETGIGGDYRMHRMYAYQLLNGFAETHEPYTGVSGHYPPLVHTLLALGVQVTGLTLHYVMLGLSAIVSAGVAVVAVRVGVGIGLGVLGARFLSALLIVWGGAWVFELREFQLYLPAVQLAMPFLARNLALLLLLLAMDVGLRASQGRLSPRAAAWVAGCVVGLMGLTRPWEFGVGLLGLLFVATCRRPREGWLSVGIALVLSAIYWLPLAIDWLELGIHASREVARSTDLPTSPFLYLPLLPLLGLAIVDRAEMTGFLRAVSLLVVGLLGVPVMALGAGWVGLGETAGLQGGLIKLERVGQLLALGLFAIASFGLQRVSVRWGQTLASIVALLFVGLGLATTLRVTGYFLDGQSVLLSPRWARAPHYVTDLAGSPFYLRHLLDDPRAVVIVPSALGHMTASRNGVEVIYSHQAAPIWLDGPFDGRPQELRRSAVDRFYQMLERGAVDGGVLDAYGARHFVWPNRSPAALENVTALGDVGSFGGMTWELLRVGPPITE